MAKDDSRLDRIEGLLEKLVMERMAATGESQQEAEKVVTMPPEELFRSTAPSGDGAVQLQQIYEYVRDRLLREAPKLLKVALTANELQVEVKREVIHVDGSTLQGSLALLILEGFFDKATKAYSAFLELKRVGKGAAKPNVYKACDQLVKLGFLTKEDEGYRVRVDVKGNIKRLQK